MLKILGVLLGLLLLIGLGAFAYLKSSFPKVAPAPELTVEASPERIARGKYLASAVMGCLDCHAERDFSRFTAPVIPASLGAGGEHWGHHNGFSGELYAPNITPYGIGDWTDGELYRAITQGVSKNGKALFPIMPYLNYGQLADEDIYAVIAYIRTLEPVEKDFPERELDFPLNLIVATIPQESEPLPPVHKENRKLYGQYIMTAAACQDCHTPMEKGEFIEGLFMAGGFEFIMPNGVVCRSSNLTPHKETGIGLWSEEQFLDKFRQHKAGRLAQRLVKEGEFNTMMPWSYYAEMEEEDLRAIYAYLQTIPPIDHAVERFDISPPAETERAQLLP